MKARETEAADPDDMFADTRMTFGEHIEDLRTHLLRAIYGFVLAFVIAVPLGRPVLNYISAPVIEQLGLFTERYNAAKAREVKEKRAAGTLGNVPRMDIAIDVKASVFLNLVQEQFGLTPKPRKPKVLANLEPGLESLLKALEIDELVDWRKIDDSQYIRIQGQIADSLEYAESFIKLQETVRKPTLSTLNVQESFMVFFKVIMMTGLVIASPWVFYQIWMFIAAGLYPTEKRLVNVYLPFSLALFLVGIFSCEIYVIPKAVEALLWFNEYLGYKPDLRLSEWLGFAIFMPLVFGISFQTPLVMFFLEKIGLFSVETYRGMRRMAWLVLCVFAAVITPSTDAFSMLFLWVPMCLLYELGIWLCRFSARPREEEWESAPSEEMVEV